MAIAPSQARERGGWQEAVAKSQQDKILTALTGEYFVAAELCRRGYVASLTLKNYPKVDIFALDPKTQAATPVQVKAVRRSKGWLAFVPGDAADYAGAFVFVVIGDDARPYEVFILTGAEVSERSRRSRQRYAALPRRGKAVREEDQPLMLGESDMENRRDRWDLIFSSAVQSSPG